MLIAEHHGKGLPAVQNREDYLTSDYLTSAVSGRLRYLPPNKYWPTIAKRAVAYSGGHSLSEYLVHKSVEIKKYDALDITFWPRRARSGEPDIILNFRGSDIPSLRIVIEVMLWSGKSGKGENDQLARYFALIKGRRKNALSAFVYLTPDPDWCPSDLKDTFQQHPHLTDFGRRVFYMCWYDFAEIARTESARPPSPYKMILNDVGRYLDHRPLGRCVETVPDDGSSGMEIVDRDSGSFTITVGR